MTGQIPKYGKDFRLESLPYSPDLANRAYVLKRDPAWFIRSDKTPGTWRVYHWHHDLDLATSIGTPLATLGQAMTRLLDGIEQGFYQARPLTGTSGQPETSPAAITPRKESP